MKKVLFITYDFPFPTNTGGKNRAYNMLKYGGNHKKYLFSFTRDDYKREYSKELEKIGVEIVGLTKRKKIADPSNVLNVITGKSIFNSLYYSKEIEDKIMAIINEKKIDIVHYESFYAAYYLSDRIRKLGVAQIFGTENVEYTLYKDYAKNANFLLKNFYNTQAEKIKKEEAEFYQKADICLAVSETDAEYINKFNKCYVVRNGVDTEALKFKLPESKRGNRLLFVGNFSYFPNVDAINYFYDKIFKFLPGEFQLMIVGKKSSTLGFNDSRINTAEYVENIADIYHNADIMVSPLRLGGGTNFKIIEAMAAGLPIVALPDRLEGLGVKDMENITVAKDDKEFINKIINTAKDLELRKKIAANARDFVEKEYSWEKIGRKLFDIWEGSGKW